MKIFSIWRRSRGPELAAEADRLRLREAPGLLSLLLLTLLLLLIMMIIMIILLLLVLLSLIIILLLLLLLFLLLAASGPTGRATPLEGTKGGPKEWGS